MVVSRATLLAVGVAAASLIAASSAVADTYCVHMPSSVCAAGTDDATGAVVTHAFATAGSHRHGKKCTRYVRAGSLTRRNEPAGADAIAFSGRVGRRKLALGGYRLSVVATTRRAAARRPRPPGSPS